MTSVREKQDWRVISSSVKGAQHFVSGLPNQDAIKYWSGSETGLPLVVSVSDGHGSAMCFRSDQGAQLAVDTSISVHRNFLEGGLDSSRLSILKLLAEERLPLEIVRLWVHSVKSHVEENPFAPDFTEDLEMENGLIAREAIEANLLIPYGTTLLSVCLTDNFILFLQLGDGDILTISEDGEVSRPLVKDERLIADETTSLCMTNSWREFQVFFQVIVNKPPALILISTDGYHNSFESEEAFLKAGTDIIRIIRDEGLEKVTTELEGWLNEMSIKGSGDDITLGILCRTGAFQNYNS